MRLTDERRALAAGCINYVRWFVRRRLPQSRKDFLGGHDECLALGFLALCGAALRYDPAQGPFTGFLYSTLRYYFTSMSTAYRQTVRAKRTGGIGYGDWNDGQSEDSTPRAEPSVEPDTAEVDAADLVRLIEARLPDYRRPYLQILLEGGSAADAARAFGRCEQTALRHMEAVRDVAEDVFA